MIWKYIVLWTVVNWVSWSPEPQKSDYGITSSMTCDAVYRVKAVESSMSKEFFTRAEADSFMAHAPKAPEIEFVFSQPYVKNMRIDSVKVGE